MPYLIDGNNLIGYIPAYDIKDPRSRYRLIAALLIFQSIKKRRIILVFDGPPDPNITDSEFREKSFSIIYPPPEENADSVIKDVISKQTDLRNFFVVSTDHDIRKYAYMKGAKSLTCKEFSRQLNETRKEYKKLLEMEKNVTLPSPLEVDYWKKIFDTEK